MEFNTSFESKLEIDSNYEDGAVITSLDFAHNLQFYETPPTVNMDYRRAVDLAIQRHQVLLAVEMAGRRFPKFSENYMKFLDGQLREINFQIAISSSYASGQATSSILKQRLEDAQSHFLLLIAFAETFQDRQWFLQQEVDLFHFRIFCERNASIRDFLSQNNITYENGAVITSLDFAHNLQFYETPPSVNMDYRRAVDLAIQRHQVEMAGPQFPKFSENYMKFLDGQLREINFQIAISSKLPPEEEAIEQKRFVMQWEFYKVPFKETVALLRERRVLVKSRMALVPHCDFLNTVVNRFRSVQSRKLSIIAKRCHLLYADSRLADLRVLGDARCPTQEYVSSADSRSVTMEMVEPLSVTSFPLCMRRLYDELKSAHHLRHGGRMQLGLFLKKIGLSLNESLKFWEYHFRPKIDAEKFQRQYAYSIRHNYGEEGKRADYAAYSCLKIIMNNPPGIGDFHGRRCPFKHCDAEHLQQLLKNCGIHKDNIKNIVNYASNNHYNKACSIFFDCMHKLPEGGLGEFITHPNQYFDESRKLYSRSSSKNGTGRFMPGENQTF
ncbi:DNA primase large subunit [Trichinella nativa]|uniref:DNA primase large subunit n=2 Tax=Trichinella TaxID=6333 RepID=A0A0V1KNR3_9BILA|nr:DNA primase large subunit [Trichinella nativa]